MSTLLIAAEKCTVSLLIAATGDVLLCYSLKGFYFKEKGFVGMVACV